MPDAELELLLSRAIDGDLSPDEERELSAYLAAHPEARARSAAMEALVARLKDLPAPEPPFALATRVTSQVSERSRGIGAVGHRLGLFLPPGLLAAGVGVIALGAVLASFLVRPAHKDVAALARKDEGPVHVFFQEARESKPAGSVAQKNAPALRDEAKGSGDAKAKAAPAEKESEGELASRGTREDASSEASAKAAPSEAEAGRAGAAFAPEQESAASSGLARDAAAAPAAPAPAAPAAAMAPQMKSRASLRALEERPAEPRPLAVALVSGAGWRLVPTALPLAGAGTYRLAVDEKGRAVRVVRGAPDAATERYLLSLSFERTAASPAAEVEVRISAR
jgi:hypothetical protein